MFHFLAIRQQREDFQKKCPIQAMKVDLILVCETDLIAEKSDHTGFIAFIVFLTAFDFLFLKMI